MARGLKRDIKDAGKRPTKVPSGPPRAGIFLKQEPTPKPTTKPRTPTIVNGGVIRHYTDQPRPDISKAGTKPPPDKRPPSKPKVQENQLYRDRILGIVSRIGIDIGLSGEQLKSLLAGVASCVN